MADKKPLVNYSGKLKEIATGDKIPIANLASGTPDGTKFIRDDGTLATPTGSGGSILNETINTNGFTIGQGSVTNTDLKVSGGGTIELQGGSADVSFPFTGIGIFGKTTEVEIDFGSTPTTGKKFTITDTLSFTTSLITVKPSGNPATGRGSDDWLWDSIEFAAKGNNGNFTVYAKASGRIKGKRKILYTIN